MVQAKVEKKVIKPGLFWFMLEFSLAQLVKKLYLYYMTNNLVKFVMYKKSIIDALSHEICSQLGAINGPF